MKKVVGINEYVKKSFEREYELEGLDDELVTLAQKLVTCDPSQEAKKKEGYKKELINDLKGRGHDLELSEAWKTSELTDEELDSAAGGFFDIQEPDRERMRRVIDELRRDIY